MSLEDKIKERFLADTESILEDSLDALDGWFQFHGDGTIDLSSDIRELGTKYQILVYLIAQRYASETDLADDPGLDNEFFYTRFDKEEATIRGYQKDLRDDRLIRTNQGIHEIVFENLPLSISIIQSSLTS